MRRIVCVLAFLVLEATSPLAAKPCEVKPVVAADTGNVIGYAVKGDKGILFVQNRASAEAACAALRREPDVRA